MISVSDIINFLDFLKPEKTTIICSINKTSKIGQYDFVVKNLSNKSIKVLKLLVNDIEFPENYVVLENHRKFPITFTPHQEIKYRLILTKENHNQIPQKTELIYKGLFYKKVIKQVL